MFVNLTPHSVTLIPEVGAPIVIPPSGTVARVATNSNTVGRLTLPKEGISIPIVEIEWGQVENLPERGEYIYLVSRVVADALKGSGRTDILVPNDLVRDDKGVIIGCRSLAQ